jgi:hypothetical protein
MPFSDHIPVMVVPDTDKGRFDAARHRREGIRVELCDRYKLDLYPLHNHLHAPLKEPCANRNPLGDRKHNWCFFCPAGYPIWYDADPDTRVNEERMGFITGGI